MRWMPARPHRKTIAATEKLIRQAEELLKSNRYDTDEARQLAQEAKYEGQHAITLHQTITTFKKSEHTLEDLITTYEGYLATVGKAVDMTARFDGGPDNAVNSLTAEIAKREAQSNKDRETIKRQEEEIVTLKQQVASMEGRLGYTDRSRARTETQDRDPEASGRDVRRGVRDVHQTGRHRPPRRSERHHPALRPDLPCRARTPSNHSSSAC